MNQEEFLAFALDEFIFDISNRSQKFREENFWYLGEANIWGINEDQFLDIDNWEFFSEEPNEEGRNELTFVFKPQPKITIKSKNMGSEDVLERERYADEIFLDDEVHYPNWFVEDPDQNLKEVELEDLPIDPEFAKWMKDFTQNQYTQQNAQSAAQVATSQWDCTDASKWYFHVAEGPDRYDSSKNTVQIYVTPIDYFDQNGYMWDQHEDLSRILPNSVDPDSAAEGVYQAAEGFTAFPITVQRMTIEMLQAGFLQSPKFGMLFDNMDTKKHVDIFIDWVNNDPAGIKAWEDRGEGPNGTGRTIDEYLDEYSYKEDIVENIASDLRYPNVGDLRGATYDY